MSQLKLTQIITINKKALEEHRKSGPRNSDIPVLGEDISLQESFERNLVFEERCIAALELEQKSGFMHDVCTLKPSIQVRENYNPYVYYPLTSEKDCGR